MHKVPVRFGSGDRAADEASWPVPIRFRPSSAAAAV